jgi:hypothetical protein
MRIECSTEIGRELDGAGERSLLMPPWMCLARAVVRLMLRNWRVQDRVGFTDVDVGSECME